MPQPQDRPSDARHGGGATRPVSVVTGGSEGIGLAIARLLAARKQTLLLVARDEARLTAAARALAGEHGVEVGVLAVDLTQPDALGRLDEAVARLGGHVEQLVNNAGIGHCGDLAGMDPEALERLVQLNVVVPGRLMRHVLAGMKARGRGGILNVASLGGYVPGPYQAAYYASKAYLISLSEAVAAEVARDGVRVTVVAPGPVETRFHARMGAENAFYRRILPAASPAGVARWALLAHELGVRVVVPGVLNLFTVAALWILPHAVVVPIMAMLLHPRRDTSNGAEGNA